MAGTNLSDFDRLVITGGAQLDGELTLSSFGGFVPALGQIFNILSANGGITGEFSEITEPANLPGSLRIDVDYLSTLVQLRVLPSGDFAQDGVYNCADVDELTIRIASGTGTAVFDMNGDSLVNVADLTEWLAIAGAANLPSGNPYRPGDANLDGVVDGSDFGVWNSNKFTAAPFWCSGDFSADGLVDGSDFGIWNSNKFTSSDAGRFLVPEPSACVFILLASTVAVAARRKVRSAGRVQEETESAVAVKDLGTGIELARSACRTALIFVSSAILTPAQAQTGRHDTIASLGQAVAGGNVFISSLINPLMNGTGTVAFYSDLTGAVASNGSDNFAQYSGTGGPLTQIMREGSTAPGGNGRLRFNSSGFDQPHLRASGASVFRTDLTNTSGGTGDDAAIYLGSGGALTEIAREGQLYPSLGVLTSLLLNPDINGSGVVAFEGSLAGSPGTGLFRSMAGVLARLARTGGAPPEGNGTFSDFDLPKVLQNNEIAFRANLTGTSGGTLDNSGVYITIPGGGFTNIVREGNPVPGGNGTFVNPLEVTAYDAGTIAFQSQVAGSSGGTNDDQGLFGWNAGALSTIAREGSPVPGGNGEFNVLRGHSVSSSGEVVWLHSIRNATSGGATSQAI
ncbi:MAG TPA: choice-of-anchor tandem repeat NxxGxxAF-containing protein, partial [Pirellulaceae bacterium]